MTKIVIKYNNLEVPAILLARFDIVDNEFAFVKGLFARIKNLFAPKRRKCCLVFIPWNDSEKEITMISMRDVITTDKLVGSNIVSVEKYISPFTEEEPYYDEYKIFDFVGYNFIYEYKNFIADVKNQCYTKPLEILYKYHPELLQEKIDEK